MRRRQVRGPSVHGDDRQAPGLDVNACGFPGITTRCSRSGPACRAILPVLWRDPYEASPIVPGQSFLARDLLRGGAPVLISERTATRTLNEWDRIAARIVV